MRGYIFQHASCMRENSDIPTGPGGVAVIMQRRVYLRRCDRSVASLMPGETLFSELHDDLPALVQRHLSGPASMSVLRQAVAWHMGDLHALTLWQGALRYDEVAIDRWLDDHVAFAVGELPDALKPENDPGAIGPGAPS